MKIKAVSLIKLGAIVASSCFLTTTHIKPPEEIIQQEIKEDIAIDSVVQNILSMREENPLLKNIDPEVVKVLKQAPDLQEGHNQFELVSFAVRNNLPFLALSMYMEGVHQKPSQSPNIGGMSIGMGVDPTLQDSSFNANLFSVVFDKITTTKLVQAGQQGYQKAIKTIPGLKEISINSFQTLMVSYVLQDHFIRTMVLPSLAKTVTQKEKINKDKALPRAEEILNKLDPWESAMLAYHFYKTGNNGAHYKSMLSHLYDYAQLDPGEKKDKVKKQVLSEINYSFVDQRGVRVSDKRANTLLKACFTGSDTLINVMETQIKKSGKTVKIKV